MADDVFLATGTTVFNAADIGTRSEVRVNAVVHVRSRGPADTTVPIGWIVVGDPARLFSPDRHEEIWAIQEPLDFPGTVFGLPRALPGQTNMPKLTARYGRQLARHAQDRQV